MIFSKPGSPVKRLRGTFPLGLESVLLALPGVEVVGLIPPGFQHYFVLTAAVGSAAEQPEAAKALIKHIAAPNAASLLRARLEASRPVICRSLVTRHRTPNGARITRSIMQAEENGNLFRRSPA